METNAIEIVKTKLESEKGNWPDICADTGLGYSWLTKFAQGKIPKPSYERVDILYRYFSGKDS